jgi:hypothetical protein
MLRYQKLPKSTSKRTYAGIVVSGFALGVAIFIEGFIMLYGLVGLFSLYFYPTSELLLNSKDIFILSLIALTAGIATTFLGFLAYYMNTLSHKAVRLSRWVWVPMLTSVVIVLIQRTNLNYSYHLSWRWVWLAYEAIIMAGIVPALVLHSKEGRALHSK